MNNLQKSLLAVGTIVLLVFCYFLFFIKYDRFGQCIINNLEDVKYLCINSDDYKKLENKKIVNVHNTNNSYEIKTKNSWQYIEQSKMWITALDMYQNVNDGNYMIFLTKQTILNV